MRKVVTQEVKAKIRQLRAEGVSYRRIAYRLGVSNATAVKAVREGSDAVRPQ